MNHTRCETYFQFDIRALRGIGFDSIESLIVASAVRSLAAANQKQIAREDAKSQLHDNHRHNVERRHMRHMQETAICEFEPEEAAAFDLLEWEMEPDEYARALAALDAMQGWRQFTRVRADVFSDCWWRAKHHGSSKAEREFRVLAAALAHIAPGRKFAQVRLDQIRVAAAGYFHPEDYQRFSREEPLLTEKQTRNTLDELQSRGLLASATYGRRMRYFSAALGPAELAKEVRQLHAKRAMRKTLQIPSVNSKQKVTENAGNKLPVSSPQSPDPNPSNFVHRSQEAGQ